MQEDARIKRLIRRLASYGWHGAPYSSLTQYERREFRKFDQAMPGLLQIDDHVRLTELGYNFVDVDPPEKMTHHYRLSSFQVEALRTLYRPPVYAPVAGYLFPPDQLPGLQGLCRWEGVFRLVSWKRIAGGQVNRSDHMEGDPKSCEFWLTNDGKLWGAGKIEFEIYQAPPKRLERVKRPPTEEQLAYIRRAIDGGEPEGF